MGSLGIVYADTDRNASPFPVNGFLSLAERSHLLLGSFSSRFHSASVYANGYTDFAMASTGIQVEFVMVLGKRCTLDVSAGSGSGFGQIQVQQLAAQIGDIGYEAYVDAGSSLHEFTQIPYKAPWALLTAGLDESGTQTTLRLETQGAVSFADHALFPSNTIYDSFAIVDTNGISHVRILQENRDVGSTNAGRLLVPDMRAFEVNHLAVDPTDIPLDATVDKTTRDVRPQDRSGVVVKFAVRVSHGALLLLVDESGHPVPVGSTARLRTAGEVVPIEFDGAPSAFRSFHKRLGLRMPPTKPADLSGRWSRGCG